MSRHKLVFVAFFQDSTPACAWSFAFGAFHTLPQRWIRFSALWWASSTSCPVACLSRGCSPCHRSPWALVASGDRISRKRWQLAMACVLSGDSNPHHSRSGFLPGPITTCGPCLLQACDESAIFSLYNWLSMFVYYSMPLLSSHWSTQVNQTFAQFNN